MKGLRSKYQIYLVTTLVIFSAILNFNSSDVSPIPKAWDVEKLHSMHFPLPDTSMAPDPVSEDYYYALPERVAYKMYPFYMPGKEPKGYYEWLRKQEPEVIFNAADI